MSDDKRPREWWIDHAESLVCTQPEPGCPELVHVIEFSIYEQALKERDELRAEVLEQKTENHRLRKIISSQPHTENLILEEKLTAAEAEIARLKSSVAGHDIGACDFEFQTLQTKLTERDALITKLVSALELATAQCGAPDAGDACRLILRTNKAALAEVAEWKAGKE